MRLVDVSTTRADDDRIRLIGHVEMQEPGQPVELFFEYPLECENWLCRSGDPFLPALLPVAMQRNVDVRIDVPVSDDVFGWGMQLQDLFTNWYPDVMRRVNVQAPHRQPMRDAGTGNVASFFSMGVDSFYTLLKNMRALPSPAGAITHLLYMEGLDTPLRDVADARETREAMHDVARDAGKQLLVGRTNVRDHSDLDYGLYYSGPCLSAVALSLAPAFTDALIAGTTDYAGLYPSASHPLVEGRMRAGHFRVISDGGELNRLQRIVQVVGQDPLALKYLRVCTQNRSGMHNCGRCQKCLRTMATLHLVGTLREAATFPNEFEPKMIRLMSIRHDWDLHYLQEILDFAIETDADPAVTRELRRLFGIHRRWSWWQRKLAPTPLRFVVPMLDKAWRGARIMRKRVQGKDSQTAADSATKQFAAAHER